MTIQAVFITRDRLMALDLVEAYDPSDAPLRVRRYMAPKGPAFNEGSQDEIKQIETRSYELLRRDPLTYREI